MLSAAQSFIGLKMRPIRRYVEELGSKRSFRLVRKGQLLVQYSDKG